MLRTRFKVVLVLLVLILLLASLLFALLTYWLGQEILPAAFSQHLPLVAWVAMPGGWK